MNAETGDHNHCDRPFCRLQDFYQLRRIAMRSVS